MSPKSVNNQLTVLRKCLFVAVEWALLAHMPAVKWLKTEEPDFDFLSFEEASRFLDAAKREPEWYAMMLTAMRTGLRIGELRALRWQDVDLVAGKLLVRKAAAKQIVGSPKSRRSREVELGREVRDALKAHRHLRGELVFCHETGRMLIENECKHPLDRRQGTRLVRPARASGNRSSAMSAKRECAADPATDTRRRESNPRPIGARNPLVSRRPPAAARSELREEGPDRRRWRRAGRCGRP